MNIGDTVKYPKDIDPTDRRLEPSLDGIVISVQGEDFISITRFGTLVLHKDGEIQIIHRLKFG